MTDRTKGVLLLGAAALWWRIKHNLENISVEVESVSLKGFSGSDIILQMNILVRNPLIISINVQEIAGAIYIYGIYLANAQTPVVQTIKANSNSRLAVDIIIDSTKIGEVLTEGALNSNSNIVQGMFDGYLVIENIQIPVRESFETQMT